MKIWCNSRYIGWKLLIRITRTSLPPVSVLCYVRGDIDGAQKQLNRLSQLAPSSNAYNHRDYDATFHAGWSSGAATGRIAGDYRSCRRAVASYNKLFDGAPPEGDIAVEYWSTVAKIPARRGEAINQLKRINADAPGNTGLQNNLALLLFSSDRRDEGFAVAGTDGKIEPGREGASKIWYGQIKTCPSVMPVCRR
ncbi:hypothetical protein ACVXHA_28445 [Escherichia coli]